jgi:DNA-binding Xre family transcriptional regulator
LSWRCTLDGKPCGHDKSAIWRWASSNLSAEQRSPLLHPNQAAPVGTAFLLHFARVAVVTGVRYAQLEEFIVITEKNVGFCWPGMLETVRQRFLDDAICAQLDAGR